MKKLAVDIFNQGVVYNKMAKLSSLFLLLTLVAGCSDGRPERLLVSGQVLIDGEPLTFGFIRFVPKGARPSSSKLDEQGHFNLSCYDKHDGIIPGVHRVEVNAAEWLSGKKRKWHAPQKYFRYKSSGLTQEITGPTDSLVINLTWDGGKPFVERVR